MGRAGKVKRAFIAANAGIAFGYAIVLVRNLATPDVLAATDFTVFWSAWHMILHGHAAGLYDEAAQRATQRLVLDGGYFEGGLMAFLNPPHFALATVAFGWIAERAGEQTAFAAWTAANLALLAALVRMLWDEWGADTPQHRWMLAVAILAFYPVFVTIKNGQPSLVLALAVLGVYRAAKSGRNWMAGGWLTVLTIKPQLVPFVAIYLAARRCWRALAAAAAVGAGVMAATTLALGANVWIEYVRHVHYLERFWGTGTPEYMLNLRGALLRIAGLDHQASIERVAFAVWLAAMALVSVVLWRRRLDDRDDTRPAYAFAIALGLLSNPHLFMHDTVIWTVPLLLCAASMRDAGAAWRPFATFALAWPAIYLVAGRLDIRSGPLTWLDLHTWSFVAATIMIGRALAGSRALAAPTTTPARAGGIPHATSRLRTAD
jgi:Glycosyltransferase family 87